MAEDNSAKEEYKMRCEFHRALRRTAGPTIYTIYTAICDYKGDVGGWRWPAQQTLADDCGIDSRTTVNHSIDYLVELGVIEKSKRGRVCQYRPTAITSSIIEQIKNRTVQKMNTNCSKNEQVSPKPVQNLVTNVTIDPILNNDDISPNGEGGISQPPPPPIVKHEKQVKPKEPKPHNPDLDNPAVIAYRDIFERWPTRLQMNEIAAKVKDLERWKTAIKDWAMHPRWDKTNVPGMIDKYEKGDRDERTGRPTMDRDGKATPAPSSKAHPYRGERPTLAELLEY